MDSSSSSSASSAAPSLHLVMAALVGASFMAISAFYIHKRSVDQVLDRLIEIRRNLPEKRRSYQSYEEEEDDEDEDEDEEVVEDGDSEGFDDVDGGERMMMTIGNQAWERSIDENVTMMPRSYRISSSLPNVMLANQWFEEEDEAIRARADARGFSTASFDKLSVVPSSVPPLQFFPINGT